MPTEQDLPKVMPLSVESWRWQQLLQVGVGNRIAEKLAKTDADLHVMLKCVAAGCSESQLLKIFL